jgi:prepilin-type N-terminal cleavage/methylation domain-containing protein
MRTRRHAFTLIELLIVVAIIAIMSAASMAMLVAPLREQVFNDIRLEQEAGASRLFTQITADAHDALDAVYTELDGVNRLQIEKWNGTKIIYEVGPGRELRRIEDGQSRFLLGGVTHFSARREQGMSILLVKVKAETVRMHRTIALDRFLRLNLGNIWGLGLS